MVDSLEKSPSADLAQAGEVERFDAIIIGAGITGLYQLHCLLQAGFSVRAFDDAGGVGGTWYWNRYPGARFDSESYTYGYSFSEELLQEWDWNEHYSPQPDNERYFNYVADKFNLRPHIQLNSRVSAAVYNEDTCRWRVQTENGLQAEAQFLIAAVGILSARYLPDFEGIDSFQGKWCHTGNWPQEGIDLAGKRVGVVGTGATAVQLIPAISKEVAHLTVFQRTPNYCSPLRNRPVSPEEQQQIKASYPEIFNKCLETAGAFIHKFDPRSAFDVSPEERLAQHERLWGKGGFGKFLANFYDVMVPGKANDEYSEFFRNKIRERVNDPAVAEKLVPKSHPFGGKRPPCESGYYEVFNQDNVLLVDVREAPIERITPKGIKTTDAEYEFDVIVFATGYDAITGSLLRIDIYGEGGRALKDKYAQGQRTYLTVQSAGFPNLFLLNGGGAGNFTRAVEPLIEWLTGCVSYLREHNVNSIAADPEAEDEWVKLVNEAGAKSLRTMADSWYVGGNIPGKPRVYLASPFTAPGMRAKRAEVAASGYEGFIFK